MNPYSEQYVHRVQVGIASARQRPVLSGYGTLAFAMGTLLRNPHTIVQLSIFHSSSCKPLRKGNATGEVADQNYQAIIDPLTLVSTDELVRRAGKGYQQMVVTYNNLNDYKIAIRLGIAAKPMRSTNINKLQLQH